MTRIQVTSLAGALALAVALPVHATDGYFSSGYGTPYKGMAGAGVALHLNTLAAATNPAAMGFVGKGYDVGVALFNPNREYTVTGNPSGYPGTFGLAPGTFESDSSLFLCPSLGANWQIGESTTFGVAVYGNGGMNTDYPYRTFGTQPTGVNLSQLFLAPTLAFKVSPKQGFGVSVIGAYQWFEAKGLSAFAPYSSDPNALSNNGTNYSYGIGFRFGYLGDITDWLSVGISYQTPIWTTPFDEYQGLFAEQGRFDIPDNWTAGIALRPADRLAIAIDVQRINYSSIKSVGDPMFPHLMMTRLGDDGGAGFGWRNMTVLKTGFEYEAGNAWTLRAGYSYGRQPIPSTEVLFNILAPGVIEQHASVGFTKGLRKVKLHFALTRGFSKTVSGPNPLEAPGAQRIDLKMDQWDGELGLSFGF